MADDLKPFHNPFAALASLRQSLPAVPTPPEPAPNPPPAPVKGPARAVVRMERAGRGGKEVTVIEHLGLDATELGRWLKDLKTGLGCGGVVEGDSIVLQGIHRERLAKLLTTRGVKKITLG